MADTITTCTTGDLGAVPTPKAFAVGVIPSNIIEIDMYRLWHNNRKWLTALGCPDQRPLIECGHFTWFDSDGSLSIAHSAPGLHRLVWATAGDGRLECRYASFELPSGQIASLDLQRGTTLEVSMSNSGYEELQKLVGWIDACRFFGLQWLIQGAA